MPPTYGFPLPFLVAVAVLAGASVGSFLNVVIARVPYGESIVWPPSHCTSCGTAIRPRDNVPVLSWFFLKGRCRTCLAPFSIRYALVEAAFGAVCGFAVLRHGLSLEAAREVVMMGFLIPLTAMDLDWWLLPTAVTWPGIAAGLLLSLPLGREVFFDHLLAAALGGTAIVVIGFLGDLYFRLVRHQKKETMGYGDVWLLALIGGFLGTRALLPVVLLSSLQGVAVGIPMLLARHRREREEAEREAALPPPGPAGPKAAAAQGEGEDEEWKPDRTAIPYGPFLSLAAAEVLYFSRLPEVLFPWPW